MNTPTTPLSVSGYHTACAELIHAAVLRPRMYYRTLAEFEAALRGHATAFQQLKAIRRDDGFTVQFARWLYTLKGAPGAAGGWAILVEEKASATQADPDVVFRDLVEEFLESWDAT